MFARFPLLAPILPGAILDAAPETYGRVTLALALLGCCFFIRRPLRFGLCVGAVTTICESCAR